MNRFPRTCASAKREMLHYVPQNVRLGMRQIVRQVRPLWITSCALIGWLFMTPALMVLAPFIVLYILWCHDAGDLLEGEHL